MAVLAIVIWAQWYLEGRLWPRLAE